MDCTGMRVPGSSDEVTAPLARAIARGQRWALRTGPLETNTLLSEKPISWMTNGSRGPRKLSNTRVHRLPKRPFVYSGITHLEYAPRFRSY